MKYIGIKNKNTLVRNAKGGNIELAKLDSIFRLKCRSEISPLWPFKKTAVGQFSRTKADATIFRYFMKLNNIINKTIWKLNVKASYCQASYCINKSLNATRKKN